MTDIPIGVAITIAVAILGTSFIVGSILFAVLSSTP